MDDGPAKASSQDVTTSSASSSSLGFIMTRHVRHPNHDRLWKTCYLSIRTHYPENEIIIIDDNSNQEFVDTEYPLHHTVVIHSEFHGRGELLPYIYYLRDGRFETAVFLHDSVFLNRRLDWTTDKYRILWNFQHDWDQTAEERTMIRVFHDPELEAFYENKALWTGCFGGMCVLRHEFLQDLNAKYNLEKLIPLVQTRYNRQSFERVIACLLQKFYRPASIVFGNIHHYMPWETPFERRHKYDHLAAVKVWSGR